MSYYTQVEFVLNKNKNVNPIKKHVCSMWDSSKVSPTGVFVGKDLEYEVYKITINELDLVESISILQTLKSKFGLTFSVTHGVV